MRRTVRYMARSVVLASAAMTGVFAFGGFFITLLTRAARGVFYTYYQMSPVIGGFCLAIFALSTGSYYANTALSMGAARRDFYWGVQAVTVLSTLVVMAEIAVAALLPVWCRTPWIEPPMSLHYLPLLFAFTLLSQEMGHLFSLLVGHRRWLLMLTSMGLIGLLMAGTLLFLLSRDEGGLYMLFGVRDRWITLGLLAGAGLFAALSWLPLAKYTVR